MCTPYKVIQSLSQNTFSCLKIFAVIPSSSSKKYSSEILLKPALLSNGYSKNFYLPLISWKCISGINYTGQTVK